MRFRHPADTTITPDSLFEAKDPFEDPRIFKIFGNSGIYYRKSLYNENQWIFNRKSMGFQQNLVKHLDMSPVGLRHCYFGGYDTISPRAEIWGSNGCEGGEAALC